MRDQWRSFQAVPAGALWRRAGTLAVCVGIGLAGGWTGGWLATNVDRPTAASLPDEGVLAAPAEGAVQSAARVSEPAARQRLVIRGTGDVNLDPSYIGAFRRHGYGHAWSGLNGLFLSDDLTVVNLECAASRLGSPQPKEFTFRCDPDALGPMREAGVEVANLGNNHAQDFGPEALVDTRANLLTAGIAPVGAGANQREAYAPALFELKGWRVAVLGFGGVVPEHDWIVGPRRAGMADGDTIARMVAAVRAADRVADVVIVTIHWGVELDTAPRADDVERARAMIDAGADGIFGHHSHRLQPLSWYARRPVAWGLGNFVWPRLSAAGSKTAVAEFVVEPDGTMTPCLRGITIVSDGHPVLDDPSLPPCET